MHPIIKEYLDKGHIDKEAAARLVHLESMTKEAGFVDMLKDVWKSMKTIGKETLRTSIGPAAGMAAGAYIAKKMDDSARDDFFYKQKMEMSESFNKMREMLPKLKNADPMQVRARFDEIASISPTVASTPQVAAKILNRTMKKGLNEMDIQNLSQIESNIVNIKSQKVPGSIMAKPSKDFVTSIVTNITNESIDNIIGKPFTTQVNEAMGELVGATKDKVVNYLKDRRMIEKRIKAAHKHGISIPQHILDLDFKAVASDPTIQQFMKSPDGRMIFPEITAWAREQRQTEKKANALSNIHILVKEAALPEGFWRGLLTAGAIGLGTGAAHFAADSISKSRKKKAVLESWDQPQENLKKMTLEGNQLSLGIDYSNPKTQEAAKNVFNTLVTVAPDLATNPDIATTYVNRLINAGEVDVQAIKTVSEIQKNMDSISGYKSPFSSSPIIKGFETGFQTAGGEKFVHELAKHEVAGKK